MLDRSSVTSPVATVSPATYTADINAGNDGSSCAGPVVDNLDAWLQSMGSEAPVAA